MKGHRCPAWVAYRAHVTGSCWRYRVALPSQQDVGDVRKRNACGGAAG
jgi:hypothetical protein